MSLDQELLDLLVCPKTKQPLIYFEEDEFLFSPEAQLKYPIRDDIPVMLEEEAEKLDEQGAEELLRRAEEENLPRTAQDHPDE